MRAYRVTVLPAEATLPLDLIAEAVAAAGVRDKRQRLLPAVAVVVFTLGCALFGGEGYGEVARKLAGWLAPLAGPGGWHLPGTGALARARRRAGPGPLRELFTRLAGPLAGPGTPGAFAFGRLLAALDGTMLDVPCSPGNAAAFGAPPSGGGHGGGGFPQVRLVTLVACGTRGIIDAVFRGGRAPRASEQDLARKLAARGRCRPGMLVIADRNFGGYPVAAALAATGADLLIRVKSSQWLPVLEVLPDGSARSVLPHPAAGRRAAVARYHGRALPGPPAGLAVRLIQAQITITPDGGTPRTERVKLITTIADWQAAPAAQLAACYAQRWEIEMVFTQLAKRAVRPLGGGREHVADLDLVAGDDHAVDKQLGEQPPLLEGSGGEAGPDRLAEALDPVGDGLEFESLPGGGIELPLLGEQGGMPAVQVLAFALELGQGDDLGEIGVQQPLLLAVYLAEGLADGRLPGLEFLGQPGAAAGPGQCAGDLGRVGQQRAQVSPDQVIKLPGGDVAGGAASPFGRAQRVGAPAAQVVAVTGTELAAGARQPARAAADQRAQQVLMPGVACRALLVGIQLGLDLGEDLRGDDLRDRHLYPVLFRARGVAFPPAGRQQRRPAPASWRRPGAVGQRPAGIGRVAQDAAHAGHRPAWLARRGGHSQSG